jgi:hypothetical protein
MFTLATGRRPPERSELYYHGRTHKKPERKKRENVIKKDISLWHARMIGVRVTMDPSIKDRRAFLDHFVGAGIGDPFGAVQIDFVHQRSPASPQRIITCYKDQNRIGWAI